MLHLHRLHSGKRLAFHYIVALRNEEALQFAVHRRDDRPAAASRATVPLLLFAVFLMLSGIQLISTGLIGEMLASSRDSGEPGYQIAETTVAQSGTTKSD